MYVVCNIYALGSAKTSRVLAWASFACLIISSRLVFFFGGSQLADRRAGQARPTTSLGGWFMLQRRQRDHKELKIISDVQKQLVTFELREREN